MDGWTDGRMDGWTDRQTDGRTFIYSFIHLFSHGKIFLLGHKIRRSFRAITSSRSQNDSEDQVSAGALYLTTFKESQNEQNQDLSEHTTDLGTNSDRE